jgi:tripartite-type tricarboxylate transporter receptor subunit TctC
LSRETQAIFSDPEFEKQFLAPNYTYSIAHGPEDLRARIQKDSALWRPIIEERNITLE